MIQTDPEQAFPFQTVTITGSGFVQSCAVTVEVTRPDGSIVKGDGTETPGSDIVSTDASGAFTYAYQVGVATGLLGEGAAISLFMLPVLFVVVWVQLRYLRRLDAA